MCNSEKERKNLDIRASTESMWTYVYSDIGRFLNKNYQRDQTQAPIAEIPITSYMCLSEWREFFFQWSEPGQSIKKKYTSGTKYIVPEIKHAETMKFEPQTEETNYPKMIKEMLDK